MISGIKKDVGMNVSGASQDATNVAALAHNQWRRHLLGVWAGFNNQEIWATLLGNFGNNWRNFLARIGLYCSLRTYQVPTSC